MSELNILDNSPQFDTGSGVCRKLRTKTSYGTFIGSAHFWEEGASTTAVYWCLETMGSAGPDDHFAHAHNCRAGRACFRARD